MKYRKRRQRMSAIGPPRTIPLKRHRARKVARHDHEALCRFKRPLARRLVVPADEARLALVRHVVRDTAVEARAPEVGVARAAERHVCPEELRAPPPPPHLGIQEAGGLHVAQTRVGAGYIAVLKVRQTQAGTREVALDECCT